MADKKICSNCNTVNNINSKFCIECGSKNFKLPKNVTERFALACAKKEIPQNKVLETYMSYFCDSVENENTLPINADVTEAMVNMCDIIVNTSARYDIQQKMQIKDFMEKFLLTMKENQEENC